VLLAFQNYKLIIPDESNQTLMNGSIPEELKAILRIGEVHLAQAINYLEAYDLEVGLLLNFGSKSLQFKRLTNKKFNQKNQGNPNIV